MSVGLAGLFLFSLFGWVDVVNNDIGIVLMLSAAAFRYKEIWIVMRREPLTYLLIIFTIYVIVMGYYSGLVLPESRDAQWDAVGKWLRIWLFLLIAWWLDGNTRRIILVWILAYIGFMFQVSVSFDWGDWEIIFRNQRLSLGLNLNASSLIAGIGVLGLIISFPRIISLTKHSSIRIIGVIVIYLMAFTILFESMIITGSRTAWITVTIALLLSSLYFVYINTQLLKKNSYKIVIMSSIAIFSLFTYSHWNKINDRFHQEEKLAETLINNFDIKKVPYSSAGRRLHLWRFGFYRWLEKPILGWGPGTIVTKHISKDIFTNKYEKREATKLRIHPHLHNTYLITLVRLGIIGALIILTAFVFFNYSVWKEYKENNIDRYVIFFYVMSIVTFLMANHTQFRLFSQEDRALIYLMLGSIYSYRLAKLKRNYAIEETTASR